MRLVLAAMLALFALATPAHAQISQVCVWLGASADVRTRDGAAHDNVQHLIQQERNVVILNMSVGGEGVATDGGFNGPEFLASMDRLTRDDRNAIDCVVVTAGGNDFQRQSWEDVRAGLVAIVDWAASHDARVLMVDLPWRSQNEEGVSPGMGIDYATYRQRRGMLCRARAPVCAFTARPLIFNEAHPELYANAERPDRLTHFNPAGQRRRADWIMRAADENGFNWRPTP